MTSKLERAFLNLSHGKKPSAPLEGEGKGGHDSTETRHAKAHDEDSKGKDEKEEKRPAGGWDSTPLPPTPGPVYTLRMTFHRATHIPVTDLPNMSSDPYLLASIYTSLPKRHKEDLEPRYRTRTIHSNLNPEWEEDWVLAGVPQEGFEVKVRVFDEDQADHDDRLGVAYVRLPSVGGKDWKDIVNQPYEIHKRRSSQRANLSRTLAHLTHPSKRRKAGAGGEDDPSRPHYESIYISITLLHPTPSPGNLGKVYTIGPNFYRVHYSPMIGRVMGMRNDKEEDGRGDVEGGRRDDTGRGGGEEKARKYDFQTNELQLTGPVPNELYHRYVDFSSFVNGMFNSTGIRGRILNKALHHQHARLYNFDKRTIYGSFEYVDPEEWPGRSSGNGDPQDQDLGQNQDATHSQSTLPGPSKDQEVTLKFLDMAHFDQGGRTFTYVVTSDALMRFTETGKEFGIDLLSKHTMHSDVNIYIAWSGEFLIRRRRHRHHNAPDDTHGPNPIPGGPPHSPPPQDVSLYELIIDNDSGTYRPNPDLLPVFKAFMKRCLPGLHIRVYNGFDKELEHIKEEQRAIKKKEGDGNVYYQDGIDGSDSDSSLSSSDEEALGRHADRVHGGDGQGGGGRPGGGKLEQGVAMLEGKR